MQIKFLFVFLLMTSFAFGQSLDVDNIYNFSPSKMTKSEQEKKLPALDGLWNNVKSDTAKNLPLLRNELNATKHNPFFYYDGAILLLSLSKNDNDKNIAANAIAKCDLADIDRKEYVTTLNGLSNAGINVTKAAVRILNDTSFTFFLPQHVIYFRQGDCLTYMLLPQKKEFYVDTLISMFRSVNHNSQKSILYTFWYAYTCEGDSLINAVIQDRTISKEISTYAKELMVPPSLTDDIKKRLKAMSKNQVDELRRKALQRFSDEAMDELTISTLALRKNVNCR
jgi:hypothetical protein